jgi:hypothetical protein
MYCLEIPEASSLPRVLYNWRLIYSLPYSKSIYIIVEWGQPGKKRLGAALKFHLGAPPRFSDINVQALFKSRKLEYVVKRYAKSIPSFKTPIFPVLGVVQSSVRVTKGEQH